MKMIAAAKGLLCFNYFIHSLGKQFCDFERFMFIIRSANRLQPEARIRFDYGRACTSSECVCAYCCSLRS